MPSWKKRKARWEADRLARRALEASKYGDEMTRLHGAPPDCQLLPFDCVMLRQNCMAAGNMPPAWIVSASNAWLAAHGLDERALRPFAC